jgi:hypothetical protein
MHKIMWINTPPRRLIEGLIKGLGNCFIAGGVHFSDSSLFIIVVFDGFNT